VTKTSWLPSQELHELWEKLISLRPQAMELLSAVIERVGVESPTTRAELDTENARLRRDSYLLRFVLPLAELSGWPAEIDSKLPDALSAHLLWCLTWRRIDDLVDEFSQPRVDTGQVAETVAMTARAAALHQRVKDRHQLVGLEEESEELLRLTCQVAEGERSAPVEIEHIWERAAPFLIVPRQLLNLSDEKEGIYRSYLNLVGLMHDAHDVARDLEAGLHTLPIQWLIEIDETRVFRPEVLQQWFSRIAIELKGASDNIRRACDGHDWPILKLLIEEADEYRRETEAGGLAVYEQ
jgi:hypothetical protein